MLYVRVILVDGNLGVDVGDVQWWAMVATSNTCCGGKRFETCYLSHQ